MTANLKQDKKKEVLHSSPSVESPSNLEIKQDQQTPDLPDTGEISDFMDGMEVPDTGEISEKTTEDDRKNQGSGQKHAQQNQSQQTTPPAIKPLQIPSQRIMIRRISQELHKEIKVLLKRAKTEEQKGAYFYNEIMSKVREIKGTLSSLATATYDFIKNMYVSLFEGKN